MPLTDDQIQFLNAVKKDGGCHASNILAKKDTKEIDCFFEEYEIFSKSVSGSLSEAVEGLNRYKDYVASKNKNDDGKPIYTPQSKFEPTIIEEFVCRILKKKFGNDVLQYGSVKAYSSLYFSYSGLESFKKGVDVKFNVKDQDVGIYKKEFITTSSGDRHDIYIPIVCIECKTYLDKTMLEGSVATADKIKNGNPHCMFLIVTETYQVDRSVDVETLNIDNIFVLRKQSKTNPIQKDVVQNMLDVIENCLESSRVSIDQMIETRGYLRQSPTLC